MYLVNWEFFLQLPFMQSRVNKVRNVYRFQSWNYDIFLQPQLIYVFMWCIQNTNDAFPELPIKERINLNFPGLNVKQNIFLRKVARPRCGSVGAVTPNSSYGGTLVWCMVSLHIIESVPGLLSTFPLHSYMQCGDCRQGRFSLIEEFAMCWCVLFLFSLIIKLYEF